MATPNSITIADKDWSSSDIQTAIISTILEDGYGYSVNLITVSDQFPLQANINIDIDPEYWIQWNTESDEVLYLGDGLDAAEGFYIDKYTADLYDIDSIDDMFDPAIYQLFIEDGNPTFHIPPESWGAYDVSKKLFYSMGLDDSYSLTSFYPNFLTDHLDSNSPLFTYYWQPSDRSD